MKMVFIGAIWCSSCLVMKSRLKVLLKTHSEIEIINYDYDDEQEKYASYEIGKVLPVVIFERDGTEVLRIVGEKSKRDLLSIIEDLKT